MRVILIDPDAEALEAMAGHIRQAEPQAEIRTFASREDLTRWLEAGGAAGEHRPRLRVQTFGNFEVFLDGRPMEFKYHKTKELFAYLVDRKGALCSVGEMMSILFEEDQGHETYFKSLRRDLLDTLEAAGCREVISQQRGRLGVVPEQIECDYFDYLNGRDKGKTAYRGEYMTQYSWGEYTNGLLSMQQTKG